MQKTKDPAQLAVIAKRMRRTLIEMITEAKSGHPGGSLSATDAIVALYYDVLRHDPAQPKWADRDRFVLSKGHCCPVLYAVMADWGYAPADQLMTLRKMGSVFQGHPDVRFLPNLEASTGSLGQGVSVALGLALAAKLNKSPSRTYVMLGDGELQEGQIWEAAMFGGFHKIDNICVIVDNNQIQLDGFVKDIMSVDPLPDKWRSFGWNVVECDGHDMSALQKAFAAAEACKGKPTVLIAHTIKGKGGLVHGE